MPPRSNAGLGPNYQDQLDAPLSEPFPKLKQARQPPMLKYERQLAVDERYHFTHLTFQYELTRADLEEDIREWSHSEFFIPIIFSKINNELEPGWSSWEE